MLAIPVLLLLPLAPARAARARSSSLLGACEGTVSVLVDSVKAPGTGFDRSVGVLIRNVTPST